MLIEAKYGLLTKIIERAKKFLSGTTPEPPRRYRKYSSVEDYTRKTGKRFRRTKAEMAAGLSAEEALAKR